MITVLICDDQVVLCDGLELILNADPELEVVGKAYDGLEAIELAYQTNPDVILMDLQMPGMDGIQAIDRITQQQPGVKILVLTTFGDDDLVMDAVRSGAAGYLLKGIQKQRLREAIKGTARGDTYIDPAVGKLFLTYMAQSKTGNATTLTKDLSEREIEILELIGQGCTNATIAEHLFLTKGTVANYVSSILTKLGVEDRTQAAILAIKHGLVRPT